MFDKNNSGYISQDDLSDMLYTAFNVDDEDAERLFQQVDADCDGKISYGLSLTFSFISYVDNVTATKPILVEIIGKVPSLQVAFKSILMGTNK